MESKHEYYIHECFNGSKLLCESTYKVNRMTYTCFDEFWAFDCFDETEIVNKHGVTEHHLYLDEGDTDYPNEVKEFVYDWTIW